MKPPTIDGPPPPGEPPAPVGRRLAWFAALWVLGLVVTAGAAYLLRALIVPS